MPRQPFIKAAFLLTILLGVWPSLVYSYARLFQGLPDEQTWERQGGNHGPWSFALGQALLLLAPMAMLLLLSFVTLVGSIFITFSKKQGVYLAQGLGLCAVQWGFLFFQFSTLSWLVD